MRDADEIQAVVFRVGAQELAFEILQVERILRYDRPAESTGGGEPIDGMVAYDGVVLPVVDLRKRLGVEPGIDEETRVVVLEVAGRRLGLVVDRVQEVLRIDSTTIGAPPTGKVQPDRLPVAGVIARPGGTILVLNASPLIRSALPTTAAKGVTA